MATTKVPTTNKGKVATANEPLRVRERLDQRTFHERYEAMPPGTRAELIGGEVFMPSPATTGHGWVHLVVSGWLLDFIAGCPAVRGGTDVTVILGEFNEPQPDGCLWLLPSFGGRTTLRGRYLAGAPEFVVEVGVSSAVTDLHAKKLQYERARVDEYLVVLPDEGSVRWFALEDGRYVELGQDPDGILRSRVFPGLWLDAQALLTDDIARLKSVVRQGLASEEHGAWAAKLAPPSP